MTAIVLDHEEIEPSSCNFQQSAVDETVMMGFCGYQIFKVDAVNFSAYLSILSFASQLRDIADSFKGDETIARLCDLDDVPWELQFSREGETVTIVEAPKANPPKTARVSLSELHTASHAYFDRVWQECCKLFPPLADAKR